MTSPSIFSVALLWLLQPAPAAPAVAADKWEATIARFEEQDRRNPPPAGGVLFVGSSSIRLWKTDKWFPNDHVLNRGFGGSQISDVNRYSDRIVLKYRPQLIVFYAGDNDVAAGKSPQRIFEDFTAFAERVAERLPETHLVYLPIKPSPSRWTRWPIASEANAKIAEYLKSRPQFHFADIATPMLDQAGQPRAELFVADRLHLNEEGYKLWSSIVQPYLDRAKQPGFPQPPPASAKQP